MISKHCQICKYPFPLLQVRVDFATKFESCTKCSDKVSKEYNALIGTSGLAKQLRAMANIMDEVENQ